MQLWITLHSLAILGSRPVNELNMDAFQEVDKTQWPNGIAVYNKRVAYAEQLPSNWRKHIFTVSKKVQLLLKFEVNLVFQEIDENSYYGSGSYERSFIALLNEVGIDKAVRNLEQCWTPSYHAGAVVLKLVKSLLVSRKIKAPIITAQGKTLKLWMELRRFGRFLLTVLVGNQPTEVVFEADTVLFTWFKPICWSLKPSNTEKFIKSISTLQTW